MVKYNNYRYNKGKVDFFHDSLRVVSLILKTKRNWNRRNGRDTEFILLKLEEWNGRDWLECNQWEPLN